MKKLFILMAKAILVLLSCVISLLIVNELFNLRDLIPHKYEDPIWEMIVFLTLFGVLSYCIVSIGIYFINKIEEK